MQPGTSSILRRTLKGGRDASTAVTARATRGPYASHVEWECCVFGCRNNEREHPGKVFFPFPAAPALRELWLKLINRGDLKDKLATGIYSERVCMDHFAPYAYTSQGTLRDNALPALELPQRTAFVYDEECPIGPDGVAQVKTEVSEDPIEIHIPEDYSDSSQSSPGLMVDDPVEITESEDTVQVKTEFPEDALQVEFHEEQPCSTLALMSYDSIAIDAENQCQDKDPLATVKSEPLESRTVASQTFLRQELYLCRASRTGAEQINLPPPSMAYGEPVKRTVILQTTTNLLARFTVPVKRKLEAKIRDANKKLKMNENAHKKKISKNTFMDCCERYLDEKIRNIIKSHWHLQEKSKGNRYGDHFKNYALNVYLSNPQSYKFVEQIFNLPSKTTLKRLQTAATTGTNAHLMENLRVKVSRMTEKEKICAISFDVMQVNKNLWYEVHSDFLCGMHEIDQVMGPEPAEYSALLMVRGLYTKWTQPVSFALMTEKRCYPELKEWMHKIIGLMFDIGLNIKAFVSDLETEFMDVFVRPESHYFEIDGVMIYRFYDVRYLFRSVRNDLMQYNFHVGSKVAKWSHILKVYDNDKTQELSLMPKITDEHVRPAAASLYDPDLAIQVFSDAVTAAMNFHVVTNMAPPKTRDTVEFIAKMSNLYEILNSRTMASAYKGTVEQNQVLLDALEYLEALEVKDRHRNVLEGRSVTGLIVTIRSVLALLESLNEQNISYLFTKILRKECNEAFFDECRRLGGNCCERPTPMMFARSFRRLFLESLSYSIQDGENEQDLKWTLNRIGDYVKVDDSKKLEAGYEQRRMLAGLSDYKTILWPSTEYITGYLIWKCLEKHHCETFVGKLSQHYEIPVESDAATLIRNFRMYNAENVENECLVKPPRALVDFVDHLDWKYHEYYSSADRKSVNIGQNIYRFMEEDSFELPCDCFPLKFMKTLFIRLKIDFCVRDHNRNRKYIRLPRTQARKQKKK